MSLGNANWPDVEGYVHSVETAGAVDGPGLRFVVFLTGCPLRCLYCHNPDTRNLADGHKTTAGAVVREIAQYRDFLVRTGGGVTLSGGEPLFQPDFVTAIFEGCKALGLHTALDTSGFLSAKVKDELLSLTDLVLLDIKHFDPGKYRQLTGVALQPTLEFVQRLAQIKKPTWIRYVLVPGLTDDLSSLEKMVEFLKSLKNIERVEILPFHKMGEGKWKALNLPYTLEKTLPPSEDLVLCVRSIFATHGFTVI